MDPFLFCARIICQTTQLERKLKLSVRLLRGDMCLESPEVILSTNQNTFGSTCHKATQFKISKNWHTMFRWRVMIFYKWNVTHSWLPIRSIYVTCFGGRAWNCMTLKTKVGHTSQPNEFSCRASCVFISKLLVGSEQFFKKVYIPRFGRHEIVEQLPQMEILHCQSINDEKVSRGSAFKHLSPRTIVICAYGIQFLKPMDFFFFVSWSRGVIVSNRDLDSTNEWLSTCLCGKKGFSTLSIWYSWLHPSVAGRIWAPNLK